MERLKIPYSKSYAEFGTNLDPQFARSLRIVGMIQKPAPHCSAIRGFSKLFKGSGDEGALFIFLKHNVIDEYDEESDVAERLRIRGSVSNLVCITGWSLVLQTVSLFHFYKYGVLGEAFATRHKQRITEAILKYIASFSPSSQEK
ncbi:unnamed protein product [Linum trigynum]|uniref:Uncharacterized protein n=1 Tax=Linum trigynum TaxID=586398 RepID=A0AAV2FF18_9ROSI